MSMNEHPEVPISEEALLGYATTAQLLHELEVRMSATQNSTRGRELGELCAEALRELHPGVLSYSTMGKLQ